MWLDIAHGDCNQLGFNTSKVRNRGILLKKKICDVGPRVGACMEVPKHVSVDTSTSLRRDDNEDAP